MMENVLMGEGSLDPIAFQAKGFDPDFAKLELRVMASMTPAEQLKAIGAKGTFPLRLGNIKADLVGGPYKLKPDHYYGIKMAEEIDRDCVISIPTEDYKVPDTGRLIAGLYCGIALAQQQCPIWVGCMGGIGRTGLYFGALAKVMARYQKLTKHKVTIDPIKYTRKMYLAHAVETAQQMDYIAALDVDAVAEWAVSISGYKPPWYRRIL
jgi:hypothetical protein